MSYEDFKEEFRSYWDFGYGHRPIWDQDEHIWEILFVLWLEVEALIIHPKLHGKKTNFKTPCFAKFVLEDWRGRLHNTLPIVIRGLTLRKKSHLVRKMPTIQHLPKEMTHKFEHLLENIFKIHTIGWEN